jgi:hypothetical protein
VKLLLRRRICASSFRAALTKKVPKSIPHPHPAAANLHIDGAHFSISKGSDQLAIASIKT